MNREGTELDLFGQDKAKAVSRKGKQALADRYREWRETPHGQEVFSRCLAECLSLKTAGFDHSSIDRITCVVRHDIALANGPDGDVKVNNSYRPFLARELMAHDSRLENFFEIREQKDRHRLPDEYKTDFRQGRGA